MTVMPDSGGSEQRMTSWSIVMPVKPLDRAKSRLAMGSDERRSLTLAMALDTAAAARACRLVTRVVVVSDDEVVDHALRELGALVIGDEPAAGLDEALVHGARVARAHTRGGCVGALTADLPALKPAELERALAAAAGHDRMVVGDFARHGTTLLTACEGVELEPSFGVGSLRRHVESGAVALAIDGVDGLRRDVDTLEDLEFARALGLGPHTSALWNSRTQLHSRTDDSRTE